MARDPENPAVRPSILDRLIDEDPGSDFDAPVSSRRQLRELRLAIRRDLENLMNARQRCLSSPPELAELERSILEYGIMDLSAAKISSEDDQEELLQSLERTVKQFEPRFKTVRVTERSGTRPDDRIVRFAIDARVYADPVPEEVLFDSAVEPVNRGIEVRTESHD